MQPYVVCGSNFSTEAPIVIVDPIADLEKSSMLLIGGKYEAGRKTSIAAEIGPNLILPLGSGDMLVPRVEYHELGQTARCLATASLPSRLLPFLHYPGSHKSGM